MPIEQFINAKQQLDREWESVKAIWKDAVRRRFEKFYWQPLEDQSQQMLKEMEQFQQILQQARRQVK